MASKIAAQMYTVRESCKTPEGIAESLAKIAAIGYESVQISGIGEIDPQALRGLCDDNGLSICATHIPYARMVDDPDGVIAEHDILGCKYPGIGGMDADYKKEGKYVEFAQDASEVAKTLAAAGKIFVYHNHSWEFEKVDGRTVYETFVEESDPDYFMFEIDTYWVAHGGASPVAWINRLAGRLPVIHFKDMTMIGREQIMTEIGEGNLDWPGIVEACEAAGTEWYIVEQDTCQRDPFESLEISFNNIRSWGVE